MKSAASSLHFVTKFSILKLMGKLELHVCLALLEFEIGIELNNFVLLSTHVLGPNLEVLEV